MKAKHADICTCPANSPFLWSTRYKPGSSFAMAFQRNAKSAMASTNAVETQRADGIDPGFISGLNTPMHHVRPSDKAARAKKRVADILKPAKSGITITKRGDGERSKKLRMASI